MNSSVFPAGTGKRDDFASSAYYFHRSCWCVEGTLFFSDDSSSLKRFVSTGTYYSLIDVHSEKQHLDERPRISITAPSSLLPEEDALHELLASCYHLKEESMPTYRDRSSITLEEKRALQTEHVSLLSGWFSHAFDRFRFQHNRLSIPFLMTSCMTAKFTSIFLEND